MLIGALHNRRSTILSSKDIHGSILTRKVRNSTSPTRAYIPRLERGFSSILLSILSNIHLDHIKSDIPTFRGRSPADHLFLSSQVSLCLTWIADYVYNDRARSYIPYPPTSLPCPTAVLWSHSSSASPSLLSHRSLRPSVL